MEALQEPPCLPGRKGLTCPLLWPRACCHGTLYCMAPQQSWPYPSSGKRLLPVVSAAWQARSVWDEQHSRALLRWPGCRSVRDPTQPSVAAQMFPVGAGSSRGTWGPVQELVTARGCLGNCALPGLAACLAAAVLHISTEPRPF